jgi:predicted restriction endonuclease
MYSEFLQDLGNSTLLISNFKQKSSFFTIKKNDNEGITILPKNAGVTTHSINKSDLDIVFNGGELTDNGKRSKSRNGWAKAIIKYIKDNYAEIPIAEEISSEIAKTLPDGAKKQITVNAYERNPKARKECIKYYGNTCQICGFDFKKNYSNIGKDFIHIHHLIPLHQIGKEYQLEPTNPETGLIPVCPNCHAMLHRGKGRTVTELKKLLII